MKEAMVLGSSINKTARTKLQSTTLTIINDYFFMNMKISCYVYSIHFLLVTYVNVMIMMMTLLDKDKP